MKHVLVVDDEPQLVRTLAINLHARRYEVHAATSWAEALQEVREHPLDLVLLDLGLPDLDGHELVAELRARTQAPIIVLSARTEASDKVDALNAGADDYVTKPFDMPELLARVRAALRRSVSASPPDAEPAIPLGAFTVELAARKVHAPDGVDIRLTPIEWQLLELLVRRPGQLLTQQQLLTEVWGPAYAEESGYLRFHFSQLRRKLEADPARPQHLITEPGLGYRFDP